jgi:hypothetical protein
MGNNKIDSNPSYANTVAENTFEGLSSILTIKPVAKYLSGARCVLRINGRVVGFAFGISWNIQTTVEEINTIDLYEAHELAPNRIEVTGNISGFRIPGSGPGSQFIQTDLVSFLHQRYIEIEVRDSQTDNLIFLTRRALVTRRSESVKTGSLADMSLEFKAIGFLDERSEPPEPKPRGSDNQVAGALNRILNTRF